MASMQDAKTSERPWLLVDTSEIAESGFLENFWKNND